MNELSIRLSVLNSKTFATKVIADIVSNGSKVKTYEQRLFNQISQPNIKRMAEDIKKLIDTNLKQGLKYTGGKVAPLADATIEAKKRKGRRQPDRVFLDSGILFQSLRLVPIAKGFAVTFKKVKYPKSKLSVMEVAQFLVDGTPKMPARPFFGITELQLNKIISRHADARRITVEPTPRQVEQAGQAIKLITGFDPLKVQVIKSEGLQSVTVSSEKLAVQEVVTTAPKVAEFVPAKTVKEAKQWAKNNGFNYYDDVEEAIDELAKRNANRFAMLEDDINLRAIRYKENYKDEYSLWKGKLDSGEIQGFTEENKLKVMNSVNKVVSEKGFKIDITIWDESHKNPFAPSAQYRSLLNEGEEVIMFTSQRTLLDNEVRKIDDVFEICTGGNKETGYEMTKVSRGNCTDIFEMEDKIEALYLHEYGHHYDVGLNGSRLSMALKGYMSKNRTKIMEKISVYAGEDGSVREAFAEAFSLYHSPKFSLLDNETQEMIKLFLQL